MHYLINNDPSKEIFTNFSSGSLAFVSPSTAETPTLIYTTNQHFTSPEILSTILNSNFSAALIGLLGVVVGFVLVELKNHYSRREYLESLENDFISEIEYLQDSVQKTVDNTSSLIMQLEDDHSFDFNATLELPDFYVFTEFSRSDLTHLLNAQIKNRKLSRQNITEVFKAIASLEFAVQRIKSEIIEHEKQLTQAFLDFNLQRVKNEIAFTKLVNSIPKNTPKEEFASDLRSPLIFIHAQIATDESKQDNPRSVESEYITPSLQHIENQAVSFLEIPEINELYESLNQWKQIIERLIYFRADFRQSLIKHTYQLPYIKTVLARTDELFNSKPS